MTLSRQLHFHTSNPNLVITLSRQLLYLYLTRRSKNIHRPPPQVVSSSLFCRQWVDTLLGLLGSSWDRTRSLSYSILARFPRPLAGYEGCRGAAALSTEGLRLSGSARQRESDRGAFILRLVFVSYARGLGLDVPLVVSRVGEGEPGGESMPGVGGRWCEGQPQGGGGGGEGRGRADATARFLEGLCAALAHR